ncbi:D-methionine transport system permease protein MetI [Treponema primitia ZAS-2]|uniref:D-methionine transport system permease protein MetI n=1 Tax=Treponema primitia (strain ATCC BAA-887 / DSM 12427 / ZAS-2) TaxID=545694 RepID=F5YIR2_TREPZ|nr:methionine ABC transporter permease [Treponema primitia]AEF84284.1 D-methionine transport system permease protein MetI [Treponema primitia ZAS-2]
MDEILKKLALNMVNKVPELIKCFWQTLHMMALTGIIAFTIGLVLALILTVTRKGDILENLSLWTVLDKIINLFRSIPFIILLALLIPVTRFIAGTAIGVKGSIVPLVFGTAPFFTRQMENALAEIDRGSIEAAQSIGTGPWGIIFRVYLKESVPGIIRGTTITFINLVGLTAMAGAVGGGGLGDFAIRYGYQRYQTDITVITVIILILIVTVIQALGSFFSKKTLH